MTKQARPSEQSESQGRYPALLDLAKARATKGEPLDVLDALIEQLWAAPDEQTARALLQRFGGRLIPPVFMGFKQSPT